MVIQTSNRVILFIECVDGSFRKLDIIVLAFTALARAVLVHDSHCLMDDLPEGRELLQFACLCEVLPIFAVLVDAAQEVRDWLEFHRKGCLWIFFLHDCLYEISIQVKNLFSTVVFARAVIY